MQADGRQQGGWVYSSSGASGTRHREHRRQRTPNMAARPFRPSPRLRDEAACLHPQVRVLDPAQVGGVVIQLTDDLEEQGSHNTACRKQAGR